jgi:hypothetical protein
LFFLRHACPIRVWTLTAGGRERSHDPPHFPKPKIGLAETKLFSFAFAFAVLTPPANARRDGARASFQSRARPSACLTRVRNA